MLNLTPSELRASISLPGLLPGSLVRGEWQACWPPLLSSFYSSATYKRLPDDCVAELSPMQWLQTLQQESSQLWL